jgi:hypothetical protein
VAELERSSTHTTVVGVFQDDESAINAVQDLRSNGFAADQLGYAGHSVADPSPGDAAEDVASEVAGGAVGGGLLGGVIGAVAAGVIPGIGPIVGAGILTATLGGAAAGAAAGGILGTLMANGVPEEEARYYDQEFRTGRSLVTVKAGDRYDEAQAILRNQGAYDIETRRA